MLSLDQACGRSSLREIRDTWGVTKEEMAGIVPESWLVWAHRAKGDLAPETDMLAAHDAVTTNTRKAQQKLGKLVNQGRHAAHTAPLEELQETARPPGPGDPLGGPRLRPSARLAIGVYSGQEPQHAFGHTQRIHYVSYPPQSSWAWEDVSLGSRNT